MKKRFSLSALQGILGSILVLLMAWSPWLNPATAQVCPHDGDVNEDGELTPGDALMAFLHFLEVGEPLSSPCQLDRADVLAPVDPDTNITPADALCIFQHFLSLPSCLGAFQAPQLRVEITTPTAGLLTNASSVMVSGSVDAATTRVTVNGVNAALAGGTFTARDVPLHEGNNALTAVARSALGGLGTTSITVQRDTTPPNVVIESPAMGQTVTTDTVTVVGMVNDIVTGTVNAENCRVTLTAPSGTFTATVSNRTFMVPNVPLTAGPNTLTAVATDTAGNVSAPATVDITRQNLAGQQLRIVSGDNQSGQAGQDLDEPIVVQALTAAGTPLANRALRVRVIRNNGLIRALESNDAQRSLNITTDDNGQARVRWTLGTRAGAGNNRIEISAAGFTAPVLACASATAATCDKLLAMGGENQVGSVETPLARPLEVVAVDAGGNFCVNLPVTFRIRDGDGSFAGERRITVRTNADGRAAAQLTLGSEIGINNHVVTASFEGMNGQEPRFTATTVAAASSAPTRFVGVVLDTTNIPIPNATVRIENTDPVIETRTDEQGQFVLTDVPLGGGLLFVDASTTTREGSWSSLDFQINVIAGIDNTLGMPIFLPQLDSNGFRMVGGNEDVVLTMAGVAGFSLKVFANSATFHDGSRTGLMGVTQVSNDQVPMPPTGGAAPPWVGTFQPPGVHLDPPAQLTVPNSLGLPPGQIVDMFSFDHSLGQFVGIGTGTVQPDGATIVSDPGSGIRVSGWFFDCPPPPPPSCSPSCPMCQRVVVDNPRTCAFHCEPLADGTACDDGEKCTDPDTCQGGACQGDPVDVTSVMGSCVAALNQPATCTAAGDDPSKFDWMAPTGNPVMGSGASFTTMFASAGDKTITAFCGSSSQTKMVAVERACADVPAPVFTDTTMQTCAPCASCFGEVCTPIAHRSTYHQCVNGGRWCFRVNEFTVDFTWGVQSLGRTDVPSADAAIVNDDLVGGVPRYCQIITDLTPNLASDGGRPPRNNFWSRSLTEQHELFHISDLRNNFLRPSFFRDFQNEVADPATCTDCKSDQTAALNRIMDRLFNQEIRNFVGADRRAHERRAYGDGVPGYNALVNAIRARAMRERFRACP